MLLNKKVIQQSIKIIIISFIYIYIIISCQVSEYFCDTRIKQNSVYSLIYSKLYHINVIIEIKFIFLITIMNFSI